MTALAQSSFAPQPLQRPGAVVHKFLSVVSPRRNHDVEGHNVSAEKSPSLSERVSRALSRRVGCGKSVTIKQLAYTIRLSEQTIWSLMNGAREPRGETLLRLIQFFDSSFANELMEAHGCVVAKLSDAKAADAIRRLNQARRDLLAATGGREE